MSFSQITRPISKIQPYNSPVHKYYEYDITLECLRSSWNRNLRFWVNWTWHEIWKNWHICIIPGTPWLYARSISSELILRGEIRGEKTRTLILNCIYFNASDSPKESEDDLELFFEAPNLDKKVCLNPRPDTVFRHLQSDRGGDSSLAFLNEAS